ncbi:MAG: retroviral-like aspartic protease family protein [Rhizobiales bacterium]|nr:retroviral-like aspartic protease family protein [Rhizobacter sp.]
MKHVVAAALLIAAPAFAQTVSMSGSLGDKALLMIDGAPRTLAAGSTVQGVKLLSVSGGDAVVEVKGKRVTLLLGGAQVSIGGAPSDGGGTQIVLAAGSGGHFFTGGSINGKAVRFLVDTGATYVSMGINEAERLGLAYRTGQRGMTQTANGAMAVYKVSLGSVRVGDVQVYNVEALVGEAPMDQVLLGNSFLTRFQMKRENDTLTLNKRY